MEPSTRRLTRIGSWPVGVFLTGSLVDPQQSTSSVDRKAPLLFLVFFFLIIGARSLPFFFSVASDYWNVLLEFIS